MKTQFYILVSQKSITGFTGFGEFWLGADRTIALSVFDSLKGSKEFADEALLHFDFIEIANGIPLTIKSICCTLEEYACNAKTIAKEAFKRLNLENGY